MHPALRLILSSILLICAAIAHADDLRSMERQIEDSVITTKIEAKYTKNRDLNPLKIFVSTQNGVVTLKGHVKDKEALIAAIRLARSTTGVKQVECNDLEIKQVNTAITDTYITAKVEAAVLKAKVLDDESIPLVGINARTTNGEVTLSGKVKHDKSILAIIKRVNAVHGVKKIISQLTVVKDA
ncbi:BON domain-containing protein [Legionella sp. CNM-4043-24]|uniref:BON domain-containing protein n=1 Tax=Legionella sp. CNM-4043-24 TaxID=3421646 RepID=UPI00403AF227